MSIFDSVKGLMGNDAVKGLMDNDMVKGMVAKECGDHPLVGHAVDLVNSPETGGVEGLVQKFRANGLGEAVESWIGPGGNHPITAEQIQNVLGRDRISAIASKFGMSPEDASAKLAEVLPTVMSKMTGGGSAAGAATTA
ncbi:MAG: YidB family protein [Acidobacteriaceae bacterium]